jgi:hypothetical protein
MFIVANPKNIPLIIEQKNNTFSLFNIIQSFFFNDCFALFKLIIGNIIKCDVS